MSHFNIMSRSVAFVLTLMVVGTNAGKVLVLHSIFAPSHAMACRSLALNLTARGHQVTIVRLDQDIPLLRGNKNIKEVIVHVNNTDGSIPLMTQEENAKVRTPEQTWKSGNLVSFLPWSSLFTVTHFCKVLLGNLELRDMLKREKFDVAIVDIVGNDCAFGITYELGVPVIAYWGLTFVGFQPFYTTAVNPPSTLPYVFSQMSDTLSLRNRMWNYFIHLYQLSLIEGMFLVEYFQMRQHFPDIPYCYTLLGNLSGAIINSHPSLDIPRLMPPTFKEVGGFHIKQPKPLPLEIEEFISQNGTQGVVLFTMGCTFNSKTVPSYVVKNYLKAFSKLPYQVLMRAIGDMPLAPPNVKVLNWLPQNDILADSRTVLFVTHCGMHGVMEAINYVVPMVGIPVFGDQYDVYLRLKERNVIVGVNKDADDTLIYNAMMEAINNKTYKQRLLELSRELKHFDPDPMKTAVWLVEHVILTKGAEHHKLFSRHLYSFQYFGLDVLAVCLIALFLFKTLIVKAVTRFEAYVPPKIRLFRSRTKLKSY